jgi:hypothetical protein
MAKKGRKPRVITDKERHAVISCLGYGFNIKQISDVMGMSIPTLYKYFKTELDTGKSIKISQIAETLFQEAIGGNVAACMFILKTQAGWKETNIVENKEMKDVKVTFVDGEKDS